jgi:anti-sigma factor RsiW
MSEAAVKPIDCMEAARRLWAYLDGELDAPSAAEVERHLGECARCREVTRTQRRFLGLLGDLSTDAPGAVDLRVRVEAALRSAGVPRPPDDS